MYLPTVGLTRNDKIVQTKSPCTLRIASFRDPFNGSNMVFIPVTKLTFSFYFRSLIQYAFRFDDEVCVPVCACACTV